MIVLGNSANPYPEDFGSTDILNSCLYCTVSEKKELRSHQVEAVSHIVAALTQPGEDLRTQCIMACGTGKTLVAVRASDQLGDITLVAEPSLALIAQNLREFQQQSIVDKPTSFLVVCSDETIVKIGEDKLFVSEADLSAEITQDPDRIREFLSNNDGTRKTIFTTLHSTPLLVEALMSTNLSFDSVVVDEAHRTATHTESAFSLILQQDLIPAKARLFITATPKGFIYSSDEETSQFFSMNDPKVYGEPCYTLSFGEAVERGLLSDYRVVVAAFKEELADNLAHFEDERDRTAALTISIIADLAVKYEISKLLTFHSRVDTARHFAEFGGKNLLERDIGRPVWIAAVDGRMSSHTRNSLLAMLGDNPSETLSIITNCRCLTEGVDVPAIDSVAFTSDRNSIDIIQAVGRAMRKSADDKIGTIIIPVILTEGDTLESAAKEGKFKQVAQVLQALSAHDMRLEQALKARIDKGNTAENADGRQPEIIVEDYNLEPYLAERLETRIIQRGLGLQSTPLSLDLIKRYTEHYRNAHNGALPNHDSGTVTDPSARPGETWKAIDTALRNGTRGLPSNAPKSLAKFLDREYSEQRKVNKLLTIELIRKHVEFHRATNNGAFPTSQSGLIKSPEAPPGDTWGAIDSALRLALRGIPADSPKSLAAFLDQEFPDEIRGKAFSKPRSSRARSKLLSQSTLRAYIDHYRVNNQGKFPKKNSGLVLHPSASPGDTWEAIDNALKRSLRGLSSDMPKSLVQFVQLEYQNEVVEKDTSSLFKNKSNLSISLIREYIDFYRANHDGLFPSRDSGTVLHPSAPMGETWKGVNEALKTRGRGLPADSPKSLAKLLDQEYPEQRADRIFPKRGRKAVENSLSISRIKEYVDLYRANHGGAFPSRESGAILHPSAPSGETWKGVNEALKTKGRGLPADAPDSLAKLLDQEYSRNRPEGNSHKRGRR